MSDREKQREYVNDVFYEAWRSGLDPDRAIECAHDCFLEGKSANECVADLAERERRNRSEQRAIEDERLEREYYEDQERRYFEEMELKRWAEMEVELDD